MSELPHTLQTWVGMVLNNGAPQDRRLPEKVVDMNHTKRKSLASKVFHIDRHSISKHLPDSQSFNDIQAYKPHNTIVEKAVAYVQNTDAFGVYSLEKYQTRKLGRFAANLGALSSDVSTEDLKRYIQSRTRFDLEQAAAVVVSSFLKYGRIDDATRLVRELGTVLSTSCMWVEPNVTLPMSNASISPAKLANKLQQAAASKGQDIPSASNYHELVPLLMRVRRCKPDNRCLHIPEWLFEDAKVEAPTHFKEFFNAPGLAAAPMPGCHPVAERQDDSILLSRKHFRSIQRRIFRLFPFWKPDIRLRKRIKKLEDKVLYAGSWIEERVFQTNDVALLCHYFFHFQRRLQRKVVSDMGWTSFLAKGQGGKLYQNNIHIKSTFEEVLLDIAESNEEGVIVAMGNEPTLTLIDSTCLLMKDYVDVYGGGNTSNLAFTKDVRGGSGRGPVDDYNLLCDILAQLRQQAREEGIREVPGPTHKFLAKDIMHWNNSWKDDAFADGKKAGWEDWVRKRELVEDEGWSLMEDIRTEKQVSLPGR